MAAALLAATALMAVAAGTASATSEVIYDNIPSTMPGNFASLGNEAYSMSELGGQVGFAGTARKNPIVSVAMSSWACQTGSWTAHNCATTAGATFEVPIMFSVYEVGPGNSVGAKIAAGSKKFKIPYRPSASTRCAAKGEAGKWYSNGTCFNGKAFKIGLPLTVAELPATAIVTVSYNTDTHGPHPIGVPGPYDSLNVAITQPSENTLTIGTYPTPEDLYLNSSWNEMYCSPSPTPLDTFGPTGACWEYQPVIEVTAAP